MHTSHIRSRHQVKGGKGNTFSINRRACVIIISVIFLIHIMCFILKSVLCGCGFPIEIQSF